MSDLRIQTMEPRHIEAAMAIGRLEGWNQTEADWRRLIALEPEGCFLAEWDGIPAGTVTTLRHGASQAWIGMMLVDPSCRRRGIADALMRHAVRYLQDLDIATIKLDATDVGRSLYRKLGFEDEVGLVRCSAPVSSLATITSPDRSAEPGQTAAGIREEDLRAVVSLDRPSFGADRGELLERLWRDNPERCFCYRAPSGGVQGFIMARPGARSWYIGPWVASTSAVATCLLHRALGQLSPEGEVLVDIGAGCPEAAIVLASLGFTSTRTCTRMVLGAPPEVGIPERIYGLSGFETG